MNYYAEIEKDETFFYWHEFAPSDIHYVRLSESEPFLIATGHKIDDVFYSFANARVSFLNSFAEDFGDISEDDKLSKLYAKTHFLTNALIEYAICLDISWQVVWAYIQPSSFDYLIHQKYKEMEKECTNESVHSQLNCAISLGGLGSQHATKIKEHLSSFENDPTVQELRHLYNYIKHCGMLHFEGLGAINDSMLASLNGQAFPILTRKKCRINELEEMLFVYHFKFETFFNKLIDIIMPAYYKKQEATFNEYFHTLLKMKESLDN